MSAWEPPRRRALNLTHKNFKKHFHGFVQKSNGFAKISGHHEVAETGFSQRYNHADGRVGRIWGNRYWPLILGGAASTTAASAGNAETGLCAVFRIFFQGLFSRGGKGLSFCLLPVFPPRL